MKPFASTGILGRILVGIVLLTANIGWTQSPEYPAAPAAQIHSVDALVEAVLQRHAGLDAQQLRSRASEALIDSAGALDDPRVSYAVAPLTAGEDIPSGFGDRLGIRQVIQLSQTFPWPGKLALRTDLAATQAEIESYSYQELLLQLSAQARGLWARLWYLNHALRINSDHQGLLSNLEQVAATQYASGSGAQENLLQIQTSLADIRRKEVILRQEQRRILARINGLLNGSSGVELAIPSGELALPTLPDPTQLRASLLERQPELLRLDAQAEAAEARWQLEEKNDYPDIQFSLGYNELWNESSLRLQTGISINIPLDFGKRSSRKSAANFTYRSSLAEAEQRRSSLLARLDEELARHEELEQSMAIYEQDLIPSARQTLNTARAGYEAGGGNFAVLIDTQRQLLNLSHEFASLHAELFLTLTEINRLTGGSLWPVENMQ